MQLFLIFTILGPVILGLIIGYRGGWKVSRGEFVVRLVAVLFFKVIISFIIEEAFAGLELLVVKVVIDFITTTFVTVTIFGRINDTKLRPTWMYYIFVNGLFVLSSLILLTGEFELALFAGLCVVILVGLYPRQKVVAALSVQKDKPQKNK